MKALKNSEIEHDEARLGGFPEEVRMERELELQSFSPPIM
jgi:hypothetical protein